MSDERVHISFSDEGHIQVLDTDVLKHSQEIEEECAAFVAKTLEFSSSVHGIVEVLGAHADKIERAKLRAIGARNKVDGEVDYRASQKKALQALIAEKMAELDRCNLQYNALAQVEGEQQALIDKLSNSETLAETELRK
ncbi:unnamed protein product [Chrysoparadoxa australica]